jgi:hypothetical protein
MIICLELFHAYRSTDIGAILLALRMITKAALTIVYIRSVRNGNFRIFSRLGEGQKVSKRKKC